MDKLEIAKKIIKENIKDATCGIFDCRTLVGDSMTNIYYENGLRIDICYHWAYFEVFGLSVEEFEQLELYYKKLKQKARKE